jgi:hypothetical protein
MQNIADIDELLSKYRNNSPSPALLGMISRNHNGSINPLGFGSLYPSELTSNNRQKPMNPLATTDLMGMINQMIKEYDEKDDESSEYHESDDDEEDDDDDYDEDCCGKCGKTLSSDDLVGAYFEAPTIKNVTAISTKKPIFCDIEFGEGSIVFLDPLQVKFYMGMTFKKDNMPGYSFSLGPNAIKLSDKYLNEHNTYKVMVPAGTNYISKNDPEGLIHKTQVMQEFLLEKNFKFVLPAYITFNHGGDDQSYCKDTVVQMDL